MMHFSFLGFLLLALGSLAGCSEEADNPGGGGTSGSAGNAGSPNHGGSSGAAGRNNAGPGEDLGELRALEACDVPEPCLESYVQLIEQFTHNIQKERSSCVLTALAERRPGRYLHRTDATFSNGSTEAKHLFVVGADGSVAYVRDPYQAFSGPDGLRETPMPPDSAQRCTLKPTSYFETCLAAVQAATASDDDAAWACLFGDGTSLVPSRLDWFESCEREAPPRCESGAAASNEPDAGSADDASADAAP